MKAILKYFWLTIKHKWFVLLAGLKIGAPFWRLIIHDWTKFLPSELPHYGRQFFGKADDSQGFINCWLKHQNRNPHHWEYWIPRTGHNRCDPPCPDNEPLAMPIGVIKEMIADWMGASRAYEGEWPDLRSIHHWAWLDKNINRMRLHKRTKLIVKQILGFRRERSDSFISIESKEAYERGVRNGTQDYYENCPFSSVGGVDCRPNIKAPYYIDDSVKKNYLKGYCSVYGRKWATLEFAWVPVMTIGGEATDEKGD